MCVDLLWVKFSKLTSDKGALGNGSGVAWLCLWCFFMIPVLLKAPVDSFPVPRTEPETSARLVFRPSSHAVASNVHDPDHRRLRHSIPQKLGTFFVGDVKKTQLHSSFLYKECNLSMMMFVAT